MIFVSPIPCRALLLLPIAQINQSVLNGMTAMYAGFIVLQVAQGSGSETDSC